MTGSETPIQGPPTWRIIVAFGVVLALAAALVVVTQGSADTIAAPGREETSTPSPAETSPDQAATIVADTEAALRAWGWFAATGEIAAVEGVFAEGPQLAQLRNEAEGLRNSASGLPPFDFALVEPALTDVGESRAVVRSSIRMTRPGTEPADFRWDIEMTWDQAAERWRLYTVATVEE